MIVIKKKQEDRFMNHLIRLSIQHTYCCFNSSEMIDDAKKKNVSFEIPDSR